MKDDDLIKQAIVYIQGSQKAVALTGAGISTPSGIPDFRSPNTGIWERHDLMEVATIQAFKNRPQDFYEWIHPLASLILEAQPNSAHLALADLERFGPLKAIITQNIDMLHQQAGSEKIYEVHGHLRQATCMGCGYVTTAHQHIRNFVATGEIPRCEMCLDVLKPAVTLYGEVPPLMVLEDAEQWAVTCDLMFVVGSSLEVVPVADLPLLAKRYGARLIIINNSPTYADGIADLVIRGDVADVLPQLVAPFKMSV